MPPQLFVWPGLTVGAKRQGRGIQGVQELIKDEKFRVVRVAGGGGSVQLNTSR